MSHSHHLGVSSLTTTPLTPDMKALLSGKRRGEKRQEEKLPFITSKKGEEKSSELFPHIEAKNELPEKGEEVDFNSSFLHKKKPFLNYKKRIEFVPEEFNTAWEKKLLNTPAGVMVNSANLLTNAQMFEQIARLEGVAKLTSKLREDYLEESKLLKELAESGKKTSFWSSMQDMVGYLMSAGGMIEGANLANEGIDIGNPLLVGAGVASVAGGAGNLAAIYLRKHEYNAWLVNCVAIGSTLLTGAAKLATLGVNDSTSFKTIQEGTGSILQATAQYKRGGEAAKMHQIQAKTNKLQYMREHNKTKRDKKLKGIKAGEMKTAVNAVTDLLARENELKEKITKTAAAA